MIDWDRIAELQEEVGEEDFAEVLEMFFEEVEEALISLQSADKTETQAELLHFLKGSALNIGLSDLSNLCKSAELSLKEEQSPPDRDAIHGAFERSKAEMSDFLS